MIDQIQITEFSTDRQWMYLWLKAVKGFNLDQHCARSLIGSYEPKEQIQTGAVLTKSKVYYLCGVAKPFRYNENFHLAFQYKPGSVLPIVENGIAICIKNAQQIIFPAMTAMDTHHPKGTQKAFYSCRNWQFAHHMLSNNQPGPFLF